MFLKPPKNDDKYRWTDHVFRKMVFYGLSADRIKRVIRSPKRVEDGVAENTIAVMQSSTNTKKPTEIWVMYQEARRGRASGLKSKAESLKPNKKIVISAWRYPGVSPIGKQIPIPMDILEELKNEGILE